MSQCAVSLVLLELLTPDNSLSTMQIRSALRLPDTVLLLVFYLILKPSNSCDGVISTPRAYLTVFPFPAMGMKSIFVCRSLTQAVRTPVSCFNNPPSGLEGDISLCVQDLEGTKKEPGKHFSITHRKKGSTVEGGVPYRTLVDVTSNLTIDTTVGEPNWCMSMTRQKENILSSRYVLKTEGSKSLDIISWKWFHWEGFSLRYSSIGISRVGRLFLHSVGCAWVEQTCRACSVPKAQLLFPLICLISYLQ